MGKIDVLQQNFLTRGNRKASRYGQGSRWEKKSPQRCDVYIIAVFTLDQWPFEIDEAFHVNFNTISPLERFGIKINEITFLRGGSDLSIVDNFVNSYQIFEDR